MLSHPTREPCGFLYRTAGGVGQSKKSDMTSPLSVVVPAWDLGNHSVQAGRPPGWGHPAQKRHDPSLGGSCPAVGLREIQTFRAPQRMLAGVAQGWRQRRWCISRGSCHWRGAEAAAYSPGSEDPARVESGGLGWGWPIPRGESCRTRESRRRRRTCRSGWGKGGKKSARGQGYVHGGRERQVDGNGWPGPEHFDESWK